MSNIDAATRLRTMEKEINNAEAQAAVRQERLTELREKLKKNEDECKTTLGVGVKELPAKIKEMEAELEQMLSDLEAEHAKAVDPGTI